MQTIRLKQRLSLPPQATTRAHLHRAAATHRAMKPATVFIPDDSARDALQARVQQLEAEAAQARQQAAAAQQLLNHHASQVWLEAEDRMKQQTAHAEALKAKAQRCAGQHLPAGV
jgi:xylose isomerase